MPDHRPPLGRPADRVESAAKVTGRAKYAADFAPPSLAYAVIVGSPVARGRVTGYDLAAAEKSPGVLAVLTPPNRLPMNPVPGKELFPKGVPPVELRPPLADEVVHHAGQAIAVVVADTFERATHAASLVRVTYRAEPPVTTVEAATGTAFRPETFAGKDELQTARGDANALAGAATRLEQSYRVPVQHHHPIEVCAAVAAWAGDELTLHDTSRNLRDARNVAAAVFGLPKAAVRVLCPFVGGAFGSKGYTFQHDLLAAAAARVVGRPVKLVLTRRQMATLAGHRPETRQTLALGAAEDGKLTAVAHATTSTTSTVADYAEPCGAMTNKMYSCANVTTSHQVVRLNRSSPIFMRGPGEFEGSFALESALDELSYGLGIDPVELRLRNHADRDEGKGLPWSTRHLKECYRRGAAAFGWAGRNPTPRSNRDGHWLVGTGMATAAYPANRDAASASVRLTADGGAVGRAIAHEIGNGAQTVLARIAAAALELPAEVVRFELGDSSLPEAPGAGGSRTTATVGPAVMAAAAAVVAKLARVAVADRRSPLFGLAPDAVTVRGGRLVSRADAAKSDPFAAVLSRANLKGIEAEAHSAPGGEAKEFSFLSTGAVFVEARVDADLGAVRVSRVVGVYDPGAVLNPKAARSQVLGGVVMGLGATLSEGTAYDARSGRPVNPDLGDYHVAVFADIPTIDVAFVNEPDPRFNPTGARGVGEIGITGVAAAIANAVFHATGKRVRDLPITPDKLL